jgi:hypothetical protein
LSAAKAVSTSVAGEHGRLRLVADRKVTDAVGDHPLVQPHAGGARHRLEAALRQSPSTSLGPRELVRWNLPMWRGVTSASQQLAATREALAASNALGDDPAG